MLDIYEPESSDRKKISLLYERSGIKFRYSSIPDYGCDINDRVFYPKTRNAEPFPILEKRMEWFHEKALELSVQSVAQRKYVELWRGERIQDNGDHPG